MFLPIIAAINCFIPSIYKSLFKLILHFSLYFKGKCFDTSIAVEIDSLQSIITSTFFLEKRVLVGQLL